MTYYITHGPVRGTCLHQHHTLSSAKQCLRIDAADCRHQGSHSDREIYAVEQGERRPLTPVEREQLASVEEDDV
jgi:hypothetical protein